MALTAGKYVIPDGAPSSGNQTTQSASFGDTDITALQVSNALKITPTQAAAGTDNNQTGTAYTLVLADQENKSVWMSNASANVLTIPLNASVAFPIGTKINIVMEGAGVTSITGDTGVTLNGVSAGSGAINNQYQGASITKRSANVWIVLGDIGTVA